MASLEKRYDGRYRIVFCWHGERCYYSLGKMPEREARCCLDRLEESLRFVDRGLLEVPSDADLGRFLVSRGKLSGKPTLKAPLTVGELLERYQIEHPDGVKESSTRSTESIRSTWLKSRDHQRLRYWSLRLRLIAWQTFPSPARSDEHRPAIPRATGDPAQRYHREGRSRAPAHLSPLSGSGH